MSKSKLGHSFIRRLIALLCRRRDGSLRPWRQSLLLIVLLLVTCILVLLYGLVPGVNRLLGRPASMVFLNPYPRECEVEFNGKSYRVAAYAPLTVTGIFGRMPRRERFRFISKENEMDCTVKVPLHAGETVLVNPFRIQSFGVLRREAGGFAPSAEIRAQLVQALATGKNPSQALLLADECRVYGSKLVVASTDEEFLRSSSDFVREHHFSMSELSGGGAEIGENPGCSTHCLSNGVPIGEATVYYKKGKPEVADCSFVLDLGSKGLRTPWQSAKNMPPEYHDFSPLTGKVECHVADSDKQVMVRIRLQSGGFSVRRFQRLMTGVWDYEACYDKAKQAWTWQWRFNARDAIKVCSLRLSVNDKGNVETHYRENRQELEKAEEGI